MAKKPATAKIPPLVDSPDAKEIFVSEVVGAGVIGGCVSINLASQRWMVPNPGDDPEFSRVVVARLALTRDAAIQLSHHLTKLSEQTRKPVAPVAGNTKPATGRPKGKK